MVNYKPVWLHRQVPPGNPCIGIPHAIHPLQWPVVCLQEKLPAQEVVPEGVKCPFHRQALLLDCGVSHFPWKQLPADVCHRMLLIGLTLKKHRTSLNQRHQSATQTFSQNLDNTTQVHCTKHSLCHRRPPLPPQTTVLGLGSFSVSYQ